MADEETPAKPAPAPAEGGESANKSFLRKALEQSGQALKRGVEGFAKGLGETGTAPEFFGPKTFDQKLKGTDEVPLLTALPKDDLVPVPRIEKVPDLILTFTKIQTNLGGEVDKVLQKSQQEVAKAITQTYDVLKDRVYGMQKSITILDKNVRVVDLRHKKFQTETSEALEKMGFKLKQIQTDQSDYDVKLKKFDTPEKKEVERVSGGGVGGIAGIMESWLEGKGLALLLKMLPAALGLGSLAALVGTLKYAQGQRDAAGGQKEWEKQSQFEDQKGARKIVGGVVGYAESWYERNFNPQAQERYRLEREQGVGLHGQLRTPPGAVSRDAGRQFNQLQEKPSTGEQQPKERKALFPNFWSQVNPISAAGAAERAPGDFIGKQPAAGDLGRYLQNRMGVGGQPTWQMGTGAPGEIGTGMYMGTSVAQPTWQMGTGAPGEVGAGAQLDTIDLIRQQILSRQQSTMFGPTAPGLPEPPGVFGLPGAGGVPGTRGVAGGGYGGGGGFFGGTPSTGFGRFGPGFKGFGPGGGAAPSGGAAPATTGRARATGGSGPSAGVASGPSVPSSEIESYIIESAKARGIDPKIALTIYRKEGQGGKGANLAGDWSRSRQAYSSFGPYQLHYGGGTRDGMSSAGLGDTFTKETGLDARDPTTWKQQVDFSLNYMAKVGHSRDWHGYPNASFRGAQQVSITPYEKGTVPAAAARAAPPPEAAPAAAAPPAVTTVTAAPPAAPSVSAPPAAAAVTTAPAAAPAVTAAPAAAPAVAASTPVAGGGPSEQFKSAIAKIEGARYDQMGGAGGKYAGKYQMGAGAIQDSAKRLGEKVPSTEQFLKDPAMQERYMDAYVKINHDRLMKNPKYAMMSPQEQMQALGYAHNQGAGGASKWIRTGQVGRDAFGTAGTKYSQAIAALGEKAGTMGTVAAPTVAAATTAPIGYGPGAGVDWLSPGPSKAVAAVPAGPRAAAPGKVQTVSYGEDVMTGSKPFIEGTPFAVPIIAQSTEGGRFDESLEKLSPAAVERLKKQAVAAKAAGLDHLTIHGAESTKGHVSHKFGTETDVQGYTADGKPWSRDQRAMVALGAIPAGAERFGFYGGQELHTGGEPTKGKPRAAWGPGGATSGVPVSSFTPGLEREIAAWAKGEGPMPRSEVLEKHLAAMERGETGTEVAKVEPGPPKPVEVTDWLGKPKPVEAAGPAAPTETTKPAPEVPKPQSLLERAGIVSSAHAEGAPEKKPFDVEATRKDLERKTAGTEGKVPPMPAVSPKTEATVSKTEAAALTEARRKTKGAYPGAQPAGKPAAEKAPSAPAAAATKAPAMAAHHIAPHAAAPEQHISPVRIEPAISVHAPPPPGPAQKPKPGPRLEPTERPSSPRREHRTDPKGAEHRPRETAKATKESKASPDQSIPSGGGARDHGGGGGGTSPDLCHFCDP